jgi:anti-anti-sigma factor
MIFSSEEKNNVIIETVNLKRAITNEAEEFKTHFLNNVNSKNKRYIIDLTKCEYMDSSFLGSIIYVYKKISESGGELKVVAPHQDLKILLEITSVNKFVDVFETKSAALKSFSKMTT